MLGRAGGLEGKRRDTRVLGAGSELADDDGEDKHLHDKHLQSPVLRGAQHVLRHVLRQVSHERPSRVTLGQAWKMTRAGGGAAVAAVAVVVVVVSGGKLVLEHRPSGPSTPSTKGKRLRQHTCIGRVAHGQRGGGMRVLGVF